MKSFRFVAPVLAAAMLAACSPAAGPEEQDENAPVAMANATPKNIGQVLASDKFIYSSAGAAEAAGAKVCGVVCYIGNETGDEKYRHGLALSMKNFNGNGEPWNNTSSSLDNPAQYNQIGAALDAKEDGYALTHLGDRTTNSYKWPGFYYCYWNNTGSDEYVTTTAPAGTSGWFMPSIFQWNQIMNGLNDNEARLTTAQNASLSAFYANDILIERGAQPLKDGAYWSSSEHSENNAWVFWANYGKVTNQNKTWSYYIRSVLAF